MIWQLFASYLAFDHGREPPAPRQTCSVYKEWHPRVINSPLWVYLVIGSSRFGRNWVVLNATRAGGGPPSPPPGCLRATYNLGKCFLVPGSVADPQRPQRVLHCPKANSPPQLTADQLFHQQALPGFGNSGRHANVMEVFGSAPVAVCGSLWC